MKKFGKMSFDLHLEKLEREKIKGCKNFLIFIHQNYAPENTFNLTKDLLANDKIRQTMRRKFAPIFHPDKAVNQP